MLNTVRLYYGVLRVEVLRNSLARCRSREDARAKYVHAEEGEGVVVLNGTYVTLGFLRRVNVTARVNVNRSREFNYLAVFKDQRRVRVFVSHICAGLAVMTGTKVSRLALNYNGGSSAKDAA